MDSCGGGKVEGRRRRDRDGGPVGGTGGHGDHPSGTGSSLTGSRTSSTFFFSSSNGGTPRSGPGTASSTVSSPLVRRPVGPGRLQVSRKTTLTLGREV